MTQRPRKGSIVNVAVDTVRFAFLTRSWTLLMVLVFGVIALLVGIVVQIVLPWSIYPFV